jgi:hypothetical protein
MFSVLNLQTMKYTTLGAKKKNYLPTVMSVGESL